MDNNNCKVNESYKNNSVSINLFNNLLIKEFLACPDLNKFNSRSNLFFKNGISMGYWFGKNMDKILRSKNPICIEISKQYEKKKKMEELKKKNAFIKYKHMFYVMNNLDKFNYNSGLTFPDGMFVSEWFYSNINIILSSDNVIDEQIKKQYNNYLDFQKLKMEFLHADVQKFDENGCVRFLTGAIMNFWWENNKDKILSSNDSVSLKIKEQYEKYLALIDNSKIEKRF